MIKVRSKKSIKKSYVNGLKQSRQTILSDEFKLKLNDKQKLDVIDIRND